MPLVLWVAITLPGFTFIYLSITGALPYIIILLTRFSCLLPLGPHVTLARSHILQPFIPAAKQAPTGRLETLIPEVYLCTS